jgi:hypothetical protein
MFTHFLRADRHHCIPLWFLFTSLAGFRMLIIVIDKSCRKKNTLTFPLSNSGCSFDRIITTFTSIEESVVKNSETS